MRSTFRAWSLVAALVLVGAASAEDAPRNKFSAMDEGLISLGKSLTGWKDCLAKQKTERVKILSEHEDRIGALTKAGAPQLAPLPAKEPKPEPAVVESKFDKKSLEVALPRAPDAKHLEKCRGGFDPRAAMLKKKFGHNFQNYYLCEAIASDSKKPCAELANLHNPRYDFAVECEEAFSHVLFARHVLERSGKAWQYCEPLLMSTFHYSAAEAQAKRKSVCGPLIEHDIARACDALNGAATTQSGFLKPFEVNCVRDLKACLLGEMRKEASPGGCAIVYDLRRAVAAKSPEACGKSTVCRVLMGQGKQTCESDLVAAREEFCRDPISWDPEFGISLAEKLKVKRQQVAVAEASAAAAKAGIDKTLKSPAGPNRAALEAAESMMRTKLEVLDKACAAYPVEIRAGLDKVFTLMSDPILLSSKSIESRRERYNQLLGRYSALYKGSVASQAAAKPKK
jgi:hypothetical protein